MVCKTFPGTIAHQIIRDNRLWRRQMYGEGAAGTPLDHFEEMELWGAAAQSAAQSAAPSAHRAVTTAGTAQAIGAAASIAAATKPRA